MIRNLSQKQLDVMKILWDAGTPLVASDIVKAESSMNINTVQASLRVLLKENLVEIGIMIAEILRRRHHRCIQVTGRIEVPA